LQPWYEKLHKRLEDSKFIGGEKISIYDFGIAGIILNVVTNPNAQDAEYWKMIWFKAPPSVKKYINDVSEVLKSYLEARNNKYPY